MVFVVVGFAVYVALWLVQYPPSCPYVEYAAGTCPAQSVAGLVDFAHVVAACGVAVLARRAAEWLLMYGETRRGGRDTR